MAVREGLEPSSLHLNRVALRPFELPDQGGGAEGTRTLCLPRDRRVFYSMLNYGSMLYLRAMTSRSLLSHSTRNVGPYTSPTAVESRTIARSGFVPASTEAS